MNLFRYIVSVIFRNSDRHLSHKASIKKLSLVLFLMQIAVLLVLCSFPTAAFAEGTQASNEIKTLEFRESWQYRWGDSPATSENMPLWISGGYSENDWQKLNINSSPINYGRNKTMWISAKLPSEDFIDPAFLLNTKEQSLQIYVDEKMIYQYGSMQRSGSFEIPGSAWHLVRLPPDYQGKRIFIRLYSPYVIYTGIIENPMIGSYYDLFAEKSSILVNTLSHEIDYVILAGLFIIIGVILIVVFFIRKKQEKEFVSLGFSTALLGIWILTESKLRLVFLDSPVIWVYTAYLSIQLMPLGFCTFIDKMVSQRNRPLRVFQKVFAFYTPLTFFLDFSGILSLAVSIRAFHILLVITMAFILKTIIPLALNKILEARILVISFAVLSSAGIIDIIDRFYYPVVFLKNHHLTQWAMLFFIFSLIYIIAKRFMDIHNELKRYSKEIEMKNTALNHMFDEVKSSKEKISKWSDILEQAVIQKTDSIRNLLNSAGQGFLSFGRDLVVNDEYSSLCIDIFGDRIEKKDFPGLVYLEDAEQKEFLERLLKKIFTEENPSKRDTFISLLPGEALIRNRNMSIDFKIITTDGRPETIMAVLTDITDKRKLENQIEQERNLLKMVVKIVVNSDDFIEYMNDYTSFCRHGIYEILQSGQSTNEILASVFRTIHTLKGSFSQLDAVNIVSKLHELESSLIEMKKNADKISFGELRRFFIDLNLTSWLDKDFDTIKSILGEEYLHQLLMMDRSIIADKQKLVEIEKKILQSIPKSQQQLILPQIRQLRYKPFKSLLKSYPEYVSKLSERMEKPVNQLVIEGGDIPVFPDRYLDFSKSLVHIFRNIVDHGLESSEERLEKGKDEFGTISCKINLINNKIFLLISDDGRGINPDEVRTRAIEEGILDNSTANDLSEMELFDVLFTEGFSTKKTVTEFSGRGIGLAAVKKEVEKLGGSLKVFSEAGKGTEFHFFLPFEDIYDLPELSIYDIIYPLVQKTKKYIEGQAKSLLLSSNEDLKVIQTSELPLQRFTTFISLRGIVEGKIALSFDENISELISGELLSGEMSSEDRKLYMEDSVAESSNIIIGNSLKKFASHGESVCIDSPVCVYSQQAVIRFPEPLIWTCNLSFDSGNMSISFLLN